MHLPSWEDISALESVKVQLGGHASVVIAHGNAASGFPWDSSSALAELGRTLSPGGRICARFGVNGLDVDRTQRALEEARYHVKAWHVESDAGVLEFIAAKA